MTNYTIRHAQGKVALDGDFYTDSEWKQANIIHIDKCVMPENPAFAAKVQLKLLYDAENIYGLFLVDDQYVRAVRTGYQQDVCCDSCVEFFVKPAGCPRYFNLEVSANGAMLLYNIERLREGVYSEIPVEDCATIERFHSLPNRVEPEITEPVTWRLGFRWPVAFFVKYAGINPNLSGQEWTANATKCCEESSHPHWLSWQTLPKLDFHLPDSFGKIIFE